ncbi:hypothetical protein A0H81_09380 [Grifola frondosa]|uniref:Uncharacterized protein n=1 Tax=Grifola frondosa TaxID=5627 RepID=A0A1C7M1T2_GRIFR|nr:hypothetical protein A0H81_09380 [Grifola frondosa]
MGPPLYRAMASVATPAPATRWERIRDFHLRLLRTPSLRWVGRSALIVNEAYDLPNVEAPWNIAAMPTPRPDAQVRAFVVRNVEFRTPVDVIRGDGVLLIDETPDAPRGCPEVPAMRRNSDPAGRRSGGNERRESALVASLLVARPPAARPFGGWPELAYPASPQYMPQSPTPPAPPPSSQTRMSMDDGIEYLETVVEEAVTDSEEEARRRKLTSDVEMKDGEREETARAGRRRSCRLEGVDGETASAETKGTAARILEQRDSCREPCVGGAPTDVAAYIPQRPGAAYGR